LLRGEEAVEIGPLFGCRAEDQRNGRQGYGSVQRAEIVLHLRHGVNVTCHADEERLGGERCGEDTSDEKGSWNDFAHDEAAGAHLIVTPTNN
jgi:hypothetical protein